MADTQKVRQSSMKPIERINALLAGQPIDRVPVWLWLQSADFTAPSVGYPLASIYSDAEKSFWAQVWTQEMYGSDDIPRSSVNAGVLAFGGEIKLPTEKYDMGLSVIRRPVQSEEDAWKLKLPDDVKTAGPIPFYMQFAKLQEKLGFPITVRVDSPLNFVESMCGMDLFCRWLIKKPEVIHHLLRLANEYSLQVVRYWIDTFTPERIIVQTVTPITSIISPKQFETFVLPYQKELHEKILAMGVKHIFCHICGEQNLNLPYWAQIPMGVPGIASFSQQVDLTTAIKYLGDNCIITGNIDPAVILRGTHEQVYELCKQAIEKAKHAPRGYILMPGCGVASLAPPYNVYMMKKAVDHFGWYDQ